MLSWTDVYENRFDSSFELIDMFISIADQQQSVLQLICGLKTNQPTTVMWFLHGIKNLTILKSIYWLPTLGKTQL